MSETRATKSGLALEAQRKMKAKYDQSKASECMQWIMGALRDRDIKELQDCDCSGDPRAVFKTLQNGRVLMQLLEKIDPASYKDSKKGRDTPFEVRVRIEEFLKRIKKDPLSIAEHSTFATDDLFEENNMAQVITCLEAVARKSLQIGSPAGGFGPIESEGNKREFSEEQLNAGKNVIGLQMGTNKGASQAGQNFGKTRMITD